MKKILNKKHLIVVMSIFLLIVVFDKFTKPVALAYVQSIESVETIDNKVSIKFKDEVTSYKAEENVDERGKTVLNILAYKTPIEAMLKSGGDTLIVDVSNPVIDEIYFNEVMIGEYDTVLYGDKNIEKETKPNIVLNYYFLLSAVCMIITVSLRGLINNKKGRQVIAGILSVSSAYLISNFLVKGFTSTSYFFQRDLIIIILLSLLLTIVFLYALDEERS